MDRHLAQREFDAQLDAQLRQRQAPNANNQNQDGEDIRPGVVLENEDGQARAIFNLNLDYKYFPSYFSIVFSVIGGYLFLAYALTTLVGYLLNLVYFKIIAIMVNGVSILGIYMNLPGYHQRIVEMWPIVTKFESALYDAIILPVVNLYFAYTKGTEKHGMLVRMIAPASTYLTFIALCCIVPEILSRGHSKKNRLKTQWKRVVFQVTYTIKCTLKVLTLFTLELAGFPILAGFLIDISLISPLLLPQNNLTFIPKFCSFWPPYFSYIAYWAIGTLYMYRFAQYVGMVRQYIIRPGVLFFIRSPDDPNIKLLQDSLIYPMKLQLSRLLLSMAIYTAFILVGFGFHTRFLFPFILRSELLPMKHSLSTLLTTGTLLSITVLAFTDKVLSKNRIINVYVRQYWIFVFDICCRKIRLSSFILGKDSPTERGHVVYRNFYYKWFNSKKARLSNLQLYSHPKSENEVKSLFNEIPDVHAYFVPDGTMMRVPASDIISKKYAQLLFVPVTKDDKLLKPLDLKHIKERQKRTAGEFGYLEKQPTEFDEYKVVYVPPHFTLMYSLLIVFIWFFSSLLFIGLLLASNLIGLPVITGLQYLLHLIVPSFIDSGINLYGSISSLNLFSVCCGVVILSVALTSYHTHKLNALVRNNRIVEVNLDNIENELDDVIQEVQLGENDINNNNNNIDINNNVAAPAAEEFDIWNPINGFISAIHPIFIAYVGTFLFKCNVSYHSNFLFKYFKFHFLEENLIHSDENINTIHPAIMFWFLPSDLVSNGYSVETCLTIFLRIEIAIVGYIAFKTYQEENKTAGRKKLIEKAADVCTIFLALLLLVPILLQYLICLMEYVSNRNSYTSTWAPFIYFTMITPGVSSDHESMSVLQKLFYCTDAVVFSSAFIALKIVTLRGIYESVTQRVRDEVYGRGRILKNFDD